MPSNIFKSGIKKVVDLTKEFFFPDDTIFDPDSFTKEQLKALSDRKTLSKLLFYRSHVITDDNYSFYVQADGRVGILFKITPPPYLHDEVENNIISLLNSIMVDDAILHMVTFASRNIKEEVERYKELHLSNSKIKNPEVLKEYAKDIANHFVKWTEESIAEDICDLRVRNFVNMVSILFPKDTDEFIMKQLYNQVQGILSVYNARPMYPDEFVKVMKEILNPARKDIDRVEDPITTLNKQMTRNAKVRLDNEKQCIHFQDGWRAKVLTTEKYPKEINLWEYQQLFFDAFGKDFQINLPCPFMLSLVVRFRDIEKQRKSILSKARWNLGQLSGMPPMIYRKNPRLKQRRDENEEVIHYITNMGEIPLDAMWTLTVFEEDEKKLERYIALIKKSFYTAQGQWILKEEKFQQIAFQSFIMSLPMQYSDIVHQNIDKFDKNFKSNNSQIAPLISDFKGNGEPYFGYLGRTGQLLSIDFFKSDNYNICVLGPMGSGKSFWTNYFHIQALAAGWQIRMIDFGRSYLKLSEIVGGEFVEFKDRSKVCLNPFTKIRTIQKNIKGKVKEVIADEEIELLVPIIGNIAQLDLSDIYKNDSKTNKLELTIIYNLIASSIQRAFEIKGRDAGLREVYESLLEEKRAFKESGDLEIARILEKLIIALKDFGEEGGEYFEMFNGANNINFESDYFILEMEEVARAKVKPVIAMSFLQAAAQEAFIGYEKDKTTKRVIGVDEAWQVLNDMLFAKFLEDFARRIRKYNGVTLIVTQTVDEFYQNPQAAVIFKTSDWKIFLPHSKEQVEQSVSDGKISMNNFDISIFKSLQPRYPYYSEFFLKHKRFEFVSLLKVSRYGYWLATTNPSDRAKLDEVQKKYNISLIDAVWYMAKRDEGIEEELILEEIYKKHKMLNIKEWDMFFKKVIAEKSIKIEKDAIVDIKTKEKIYSEAKPLIVYENNEYQIKEWIRYAIKKGYIAQLKTIFFKKVYEEITDEIVSLDIRRSDMRDKRFMLFLENIIKNRNFMFEIDLDLLDEDKMKLVLDFSKKVKSMGADIIFDNVSFDKLDIAKIVELNPKYIKIPVDEFKAKKDDEPLKQLIGLINHTLNIKVVASYVETNEGYEVAKSFNVDAIQGSFTEQLLSDNEDDLLKELVQ